MAAELGPTGAVLTIDAAKVNDCATSAAVGAKEAFDCWGHHLAACPCVAAHSSWKEGRGQSAPPHFVVFALNFLNGRHRSYHLI